MIFFKYTFIKEEVKEEEGKNEEEEFCVLEGGRNWEREKESGVSTREWREREKGWGPRNVHKTLQHQRFLHKTLDG